jgi:hypothetical protein
MKAVITGFGFVEVSSVSSSVDAIPVRLSRLFQKDDGENHCLPHPIKMRLADHQNKTHPRPLIRCFRISIRLSQEKIFQTVPPPRAGVISSARSIQ